MYKSVFLFQPVNLQNYNKQLSYEVHHLIVHMTLSLLCRDTCPREWSLNGTVHQDCCCLQITILKQSTCGPQAAFWLRCSQDACCLQVRPEEHSVMSKGPSLVFLLLYWFCIDLAVHLRNKNINLHYPDSVLEHPLVAVCSKGKKRCLDLTYQSISISIVFISQYYIGKIVINTILPEYQYMQQKE